MIAHGDIAPGICHIELRRPERRNALGVAAYAALADVFTAANTRRGVRAILLSGEGANFCAGNDRAEFATQWPQPAHGPVVRFLEALYHCDLPVIAAVQGAAVGIGATMLLHCDLVIAAPSSFLQYPFVQLGISPEGASSLLLPQRLGVARAMDLLLTGRRVMAVEAHSIGLVSRISAAESPFGEAMDLALAIAGHPAVALRETKRLVRSQNSAAVPALFKEEVALINRLLRKSGLAKATRRSGRTTIRQ